MPYTKTDVIRCLEEFLHEVRNRMMVRWAVEGVQQDPLALMAELIEEGKTSLPETPEPPRA